MGGSVLGFQILTGAVCVEMVVGALAGRWASAGRTVAFVGGVSSPLRRGDDLMPPPVR